MDKNKKYYVTTPIYYVNDVPHIGHAYTTVAADVMARWHRIKGDNVFFLTGTDEHGAKIAQAAAKSGITPKELCDRNSDQFKQAWQKLGVSNDYFIRTTDPVHEKAVQRFLQKLYETGAIYKGKYEGLYCIQCEKFLSPGDLNEDLCCPDHKQKPVTHSEENYFFKLSAYRDELIEILSNPAHPQHVAVYPVERRNEIIGKLKLGLEDISISRAALEWGIPLPFDPKQTVYVWVDALLNYITAIGYGQNTDEFDRWWPANLHLMAKDILWFHSVIWPAMLLAMKLPLPKQVFAHGFFTINGEKMSKTLGNVIRPDELVARFGVDASRYLILSLFPFGTDGDISWKTLTEKYNTDLANNLGNLSARTLTMIEKYSEGKIPDAPASPRVAGIADALRDQLSGATDLLERVDFYRYSSALQAAIDQANRFIENAAPWKMAKEKNPDLPAILYHLAENLKIITLHIVPFMPQISAEIWKQLGEPEPIERVAVAFFSNGTENKTMTAPHSGASIQKSAILFPRIKI